MSDIPTEAPDLNRYNNMGLSTPGEAVLNTSGGAAYDFTGNACRFFIAQSDLFGKGLAISFDFKVDHSIGSHSIESTF